MKKDKFYDAVNAQLQENNDKADNKQDKPFRKFWVMEVNNWICDADYSGKVLKERNPFPSFRKFWFIKCEDDLRGFTKREGKTNRELVDALLIQQETHAATPEQSHTPQAELKSAKVLKELGIDPDDYPADACFDPNYIGTYSKDRKTVCIMMDDNVSIDGILPKDVVREIAYTCTKLITDFGCEVHSHTMKTVKPFSQLTIEKVSTIQPPVQGDIVQGQGQETTLSVTVPMRGNRDETYDAIIEAYEGYPSLLRENKELKERIRLYELCEPLDKNILEATEQARKTAYEITQQQAKDIADLLEALVLAQKFMTSDITSEYERLVGMKYQDAENLVETTIQKHKK